MPNSDPKADNHWVEGAKTILRGYIVHLMSTEPEPSLASLRKLFTLDGDDKADMLTHMSLNEAANGTAKETAARILDGIGTDEITNIISNANAQTEWLRDPCFHRVMQNEASFDFEELKTGKATVYVVLPDSDVKRCARFMRLFMIQALRTITQGQAAKKPVLMIIDEFYSLGRVEEFISGFNKAAGANLFLWPFLQDLGQLKGLYPNEYNSFIGGSRAVQVFGAKDEVTVKFIQEELGTRVIAGAESFATSTNIGHLREMNSIRSEITPKGRNQYVFVEGSPPLLIDRAPYYKDRIWIRLLRSLGIKLRRKYDPNPKYNHHA